MEDICLATEVPGSPISHTAHCSLSKELTRVTRKAKTLFFIRLVYFSRGFVNHILNQCHEFIRDLLIMLSPWGLAHDRAYISAADAQLHTCGWDSLQTLGPEVCAFTSLVNPGVHLRDTQHTAGEATHTQTSTS